MVKTHENSESYPMMKELEQTLVFLKDAKE